ncbi:hypothetical protein PYCC9005_003535 [Savitreella phatthalungensis]
MVGGVVIDSEHEDETLVSASPPTSRRLHISDDAAKTASRRGYSLRERTSLKQLNPYAYYHHVHEQQFRSIGLKPLAYGKPVESLNDAQEFVVPASAARSNEPHAKDGRRPARASDKASFEFSTNHWRGNARAVSEELSSTEESSSDGEEERELQMWKRRIRGVLPPSFANRDAFQVRREQNRSHAYARANAEHVVGRARVKRRRIACDSEQDRPIKTHEAHRLKSSPEAPKLVLVSSDDDASVIVDDSGALNRMLPKRSLASRQDRGARKDTKELRIARRSTRTSGKRIKHATKSLDFGVLHESSSASDDVSDRANVPGSGSENKRKAVAGKRKIEPAGRDYTRRSARNSEGHGQSLLGRRQAVRGQEPIFKVDQRSVQRRSPLHRTTERSKSDGNHWRPRTHAPDLQHEIARSRRQASRMGRHSLQRQLEYLAEIAAHEKVASWRQSTFVGVSKGRRGRPKPPAQRCLQNKSAPVAFGLVRATFALPDLADGCLVRALAGGHCIDAAPGLLGEAWACVRAVLRGKDFEEASRKAISSLVDQIGSVGDALRRGYASDLLVAATIILHAQPSWNLFNEIVLVRDKETAWQVCLTLAAASFNAYGHPEPRSNWTLALHLLQSLQDEEDASVRLLIQRAHFLTWCGWSTWPLLGAGLADGVLYRFIFQRLSLGNLSSETVQASYSQDADFHESDATNVFGIFLKILRLTRITPKLVDKLRTHGPLSFRSTQALDSRDLAKVVNRFALELCLYDIAPTMKDLVAVADAASANLEGSHLMLRERSLEACMESLRLYRRHACPVRPLVSWLDRIVQATVAQYRAMCEAQLDGGTAELGLLRRCVTGVPSEGLSIGDLACFLSLDIKAILLQHYHFSHGLLIDTCRFLTRLLSLIPPAESQDFSDFMPSQDEHGHALEDIDVSVTNQVVEVANLAFACLSNLCVEAPGRHVRAVAELLGHAHLVLTSRNASFDISRHAPSRLIESAAQGEAEVVYRTRTVELDRLEAETLWLRSPAPDLGRALFGEAIPRLEGIRRLLPHPNSQVLLRALKRNYTPANEAFCLQVRQLLQERDSAVCQKFASHWLFTFRHADAVRRAGALARRGSVDGFLSACEEHRKDLADFLHACLGANPLELEVRIPFDHELSTRRLEWLPLVDDRQAVSDLYVAIERTCWSSTADVAALHQEAIALGVTIEGPQVMPDVGSLTL